MTESSITVNYIADEGVSGSHMVVRHPKLGHFFGDCNAYSGTCSVHGLTSGTSYDVWVRTCRGERAKFCEVRAWPAKMATYPSSRFYFDGRFTFL